MKYAVIPHSGRWDQSSIATESNKWNEPLIVSFDKAISLTDKSFVDVEKSGYEISAFKVEGDDVLFRLFNAEGNSSEQNISFGFPVSNIIEIDLNGNSIQNMQVVKNSISLSIPRFGIKTFLIKRQNQ